jgi:DNA uptake protein ComE-like DNA-binding protein
MWRDWFYLPKQDLRAIILLSVLIVIAVAVRISSPLWERPERGPMLSPDSVVALLASRDTTPIVKVEPHAFDPNTADSLELLSVGFSPYVTRNILRYRRAGGKFRRPDDLARIYGMHDTLFARIKPYITLPPAPPTASPRPKPQRPNKSAPASPTPDTLRRPHPYAQYMQAKLKPGEVVELNQADTTALMRIPGVGPVYARMIVDYRHRLGGFHSAAQVYDLDVLPEGVADWMRVDTPSVVKLKVNRLSVTQLRTHPYLTFYQAKAIVALRKREGNIKSVRQLLFLDEFSEADIERLEPYLSFDP